MGYGAAKGRYHHEVLTHETVLEKVHNNLYNIVGEAVDTIKEEEDKWSPSEMTKRISGYIYKAAKAPELIAQPWSKLAESLVGHAMQSYTAACGDKNWFYQLSLGNAFTSAVWELMQLQGRQRPHFKDVQDFVTQEFESHLDKSLLAKAMWDAVETSFDDEKVRGKVYKALSATYYQVLDQILSDSRPVDDETKVERFTKRWIEDSMQRVWTAFEQSEDILNAGSILLLFQNLVAPFGEAHEYSCIPMMFIEKIGRPPLNWPFLKQTIQVLMKSWKEGVSTDYAPSAKRRKKNSKAYGAEEESLEGSSLFELAKAELPEEEYHEELDAVKEEEEANGTKQSDDTTHPDCTSQEDCVGSATDALVRHILADNPGDLYCQSCWKSFLAQNPSLEGMWEDGENAGTLYGSS